MIYHAPTDLPRTQFRPSALDVIYLLGLGLIAIGLVLTQARGGLLAAAAGVYTLLLLLALTRRWRRVIVALIVAAVMAVAGTVILSRIDWGDSFLTRLPLISRLNPALPDSPRIAREIIWGSTLEIVVNPAPLADVYGTPDPFYPLRRWFGHGLESFETVFRPLVTAELRRHEGGRPIDRAHNDWLDTGVTAGWFGIVARMLLWVGIVVVGWRILRREPHALTLSEQSKPHPLTPSPNMERGNTTILVMLAVVAAHFVDLSFNFTSVLTGWAFWLAVGVLLKQGEFAPAPDAQSIRPEESSRLKTAVPGRFSVLTKASSRWLSANGRIIRVVQITLFLSFAVLWIADASADILVQHGLGANSFLTQTNADLRTLEMTVSLRPWDDRLWNAAANGAIRVISTLRDMMSQSLMLSFAHGYLENALTLNRYDAPSAYLMAVLATWQADHAASVDDVEKWLNEAEAYHAAAARLMPGEPYIWREWGRFMLTYRGDETAARQYLERTLALDPGDAAALELLEMLAPSP